MHKYEIIDVIDEGAYGIVWKALNKESNGLGTSKGSELRSSNSNKAIKTSFLERLFSERLRCLKCSKANM